MRLKTLLLLYQNLNFKWLSGRVVMQRTATPLTSVRFRSQPPDTLISLSTHKFYRLLPIKTINNKLSIDSC